MPRTNLPFESIYLIHVLLLLFVSQAAPEKSVQDF